MPMRPHVRDGAGRTQFCGFGADLASLLQYPAQRQSRGVIAHGRDANSGPICIGDTADPGVGRHQVGKATSMNGGEKPPT